jgi:hypothetical protein
MAEFSSAFGETMSASVDSLSGYGDCFHSRFR